MRDVASAAYSPLPRPPFPIFRLRSVPSVSVLFRLQTVSEDEAHVHLGDRTDEPDEHVRRRHWIREYFGPAHRSIASARCRGLISSVLRH